MTITNHGLANIYVARHSRTMLYDDETEMYWWYRNFIWEPVSNDKLIDHVGDFCESQHPKARFTMATFKDIATQCRRKIMHFEEINDSWLAFDDCLYNPDTNKKVPHPEQSIKIDKERNYLDDDPHANIYTERIASIRMKMDYGEMRKAEAPMFMKYINDVAFDPETEEIDIGTALQLQETYGLLLSSINPHKCVICFGDGGTGKSQGFHIMRHLVSKPRTLAQGLSNLTKKDFTLPSLVGKRANIKDEEHSSSSDIGLLKTIIAGEPITCCRKYESDFTFEPKVKMIFGSNKFPRLDSFDNSIKRRFLIISLENIIPKNKRIIGLADKIIKAGELKGIVRWALEGLERLHENNFQFTSNARSERAMDEFKATSSSVAEYLMEFWEIDEKSKVSAKDIYGAYCHWCQESNRKPVSSNRFAREAVSVLGKSKSMRIKGTNGEKDKIVTGYSAKRIHQTDIQEQIKF